MSAAWSSIVANFPLLVKYLALYGIVLLLVAMGGMWSEHSGIINIALEGIMTIGAVAGALVLCILPADMARVWIIIIPILSACAAGVLYSCLLAIASINLKADQTIGGTALNLMGTALALVLVKNYNITHAGNQSPKLVYSNAAYIFNFGPYKINIFLFIGLALLIISYLLMYKTKFGLRLRSCGENPQAADSLGINVAAKKYQHIMLGSGIMGIGGLYMGLNLGGTFEGSNCWINGYGWIAIALVIFANWSTSKAIFGTFVFGFFNTLRIYNAPLAATFPNALGWLSKIPAQFFSALPFIVTLIVLIVSSMRQSKNSNCPTAIGLNYYREDR